MARLGIENDFEDFFKWINFDEDVSKNLLEFYSFMRTNTKTIVYSQNMCFALVFMCLTITNNMYTKESFKSKILKGK